MELQEVPLIVGDAVFVGLDATLFDGGREGRKEKEGVGLHCERLRRVDEGCWRLFQFVFLCLRQGELSTFSYRDWFGCCETIMLSRKDRPEAQTMFC